MKVYCNECHWFSDFEFECVEPSNLTTSDNWYKRIRAYKKSAPTKNKNNDCPDFRPRGRVEKIQRFWGIYD